MKKELLVLAIILGWVSSRVLRPPQRKSRLRKKYSRALKGFFSKLWRARKLQGLFPMYGGTVKIDNLMGGSMAVKMPDNPSPIFINQSPFYSFRL